MRWSVVISTLLLLPVLLASGSAPLVAASAESSSTFIVVETNLKNNGIFVPTGEGDLWFADHEGINRIGPSGVTQGVLALHGALLGVDGDGGFYVKDWDQRETLRRVDVDGSQPVTDLSGPVMFNASGALLLLHHSSIYEVATDGTLAYLGPVPGEYEYPTMGPDEQFYFYADRAIQRMDLATGERTILKTDVFTVGGLALDLAGNVYYGRSDSVDGERGFSLMRLDPSTGIETRLGFEPDHYLRVLAFSGSNLWAVRYPYGAAGFQYETGYYALDRTGFVGFRSSFVPGPAADIEVTDLVVEPVSLPVPAEVHGQYVVRFTLRNSGAVATAAAFNVAVVSVLQEPHLLVRVLDAPGSIAGNHQVARFSVDAGLLPGEARQYEIQWDASADVGLHELVVRADLGWREPNVREVEEEANNWASQLVAMRTTGSPV